MRTLVSSSHDLRVVGGWARKSFLAVFLGAVLPMGCWAQSPEPVITLYGGTGGELVNWCAAVPRMSTQAGQASANDAAAVSYCFGYLLGIVDTHTAFQAFSPMSDEDRYCIPTSASRERLAAIIIKYGQDHPEELKEPALLFISNAFHSAFPCR